jgi:hypothetical protein
VIVETCKFDGKTYQRIKSANGFRYKGQGRDGVWRDLNPMRNRKLIAIIDSIFIARMTDQSDAIKA